jgi:hypothetical protein
MAVSGDKCPPSARSDHLNTVTAVANRRLFGSEVIRKLKMDAERHTTDSRSYRTWEQSDTHPSDERAMRSITAAAAWKYISIITTVLFYGLPHLAAVMLLQSAFGMIFKSAGK